MLSGAQSVSSCIPTSLPGGRLGPEAYAFVDWLAAAGARGGRCCRSIRPTSSARPTRPHRRSPRGAACSADPEAPVGPREAAGVPGAGGDVDRRLGGVRRRAARSRSRCGSSASGSRSARTLPSAACRIIGDVPIYVAVDGCDHRAHPELFLPLDEVVAGAPPDDLNDLRPAVGQPALRLGGDGRGRLPLVDRADAPRPRPRRPSSGSTTSAGSPAYWTVPAGAETRARRLLVARARHRPLPRRRGGARPTAGDRRGPRRHHAGRPRAPRRARASRAWSCCSGPSTGSKRQPAPAREPPCQPGRLHVHPRHRHARGRHRRGPMPGRSSSARSRRAARWRSSPPRTSSGSGARRA